MGWNISVVDLDYKDITEFSFEFHDIPCTGLYQCWATDEILTKNVVEALRNAKCRVDYKIKPWYSDKFYTYYIRPPVMFEDMPKSILDRETDKLPSLRGYQADDIKTLYESGKND